MTKGMDIINMQRAQDLQNNADKLTAQRELSALFTGPVMTIYGPSWLLAFSELYFAGYTDWKDGVKAKESVDILGYSLNEDGKNKDRDADKASNYSGLIGTIFRDVVDGNYLSGSFVGAITTGSAVRDFNIKKLRAKSPVNESSIQINRINTGLRIGSLALGMSPIGKTKVGRHARNVGLGSSFALATIGYFQTKKQLRQEVI